MSSDDRIEAVNALGARVTYPRPVPLARCRYGTAWCPICPGNSINFGRLSCPECQQVFDWSTWNLNLTRTELDVHMAGRVTRPCTNLNRCVGCKVAEAWHGDFRPMPFGFKNLDEFQYGELLASPERSRLLPYLRDLGIWITPSAASEAG